MNPLLKTLLLTFLDDLREHYSNASCNDFDLSAIIPDPETRRGLIHLIGESSILEDTPWSKGQDKIVSDGALLRYVIKQVEAL
jgi:hypothetical protein